MAKNAVQTFGKYQILERIATGGTAEIYKAKLEGIGGFQRTFAIKRILPNLSQHSDYIAMLVDEAKVAGLLSHANIVQILDLGQVDGIWYIAMEYVDGRDMGAILRRASRKGLCLPVPHAVFIAIELLKGLEYAHQRQVMRGGKAVPLNIIHRDISPPNILMSFQGEVKLTDFGIARASLKMMETVSGIVKGRFDYMSPEQAEGRKDLDQRSDLFSVGVVLYEMLTGVHPFRAETEIDTVERVRTGNYTAVSTRNPEVPFALQTIVDRALQVDRDRRYPSATAFKEALDRFFHDAGFIFTHATLASYVKGLFPEAQKKRPRSPGTPTGGMLRSEPLGTPRRTPSDPLAETFDPATGPLELDATPTAATGRNEDLEPTAVRDNPLLEPPEDPTKVGTPPAYEPEEMATVIRENPFTKEELDKMGPPAEPPPVSSHYPMGGDSALQPKAGYVHPPTLPPQPAPAIFEPERIPLTAEVVTRPALIGWLGVVLSVLCLLLGIGIGSLFGGGGTYLLFGATSSDGPPVVRVLSQNDVEVFLDDRPVDNNFTIEPDTPKALEVRAENAAWSIPLQMRPGEVRVFIINVPKPQETSE